MSATSLPSGRASDQPPKLVWIALLGLFLLVDALLAWRLKDQPLGVDFGPVWAGVRLMLEDPRLAYDFAAVTRAHAWLLPPDPALRPFVYPPSAALAFAGLAALPFWPAYAVFLAVSVGLFSWATWRLSGRGWAVALSAACAPVALSLIVGQVSLLIGGLILLALTSGRRPWVAGALLGLAAAIKPQLLVLAPLALACDRDWRALAGAGLAGAALGLISLAVFGPQAWFDWLAAIPRFQALVAADPSFASWTVSPAGTLMWRGLGGPALLSAQIAFAMLGAAMVWLTWRRTAAIELRLTALVAGALLVTPYALRYELALLVPAAAALFARARAPLRTWRLAALLLLMTLNVAGFLASVALTFAATWRARQDSNLQPSA